MAGSPEGNVKSKSFRRIVIATSLAAAILASLGGVRSYLDGRAGQKLSREQNEIMRGVEAGKVSNLEVKESIAVMSRAYEALEAAKKSLESGDLDKALNNVINAKGYAKSISPAFRRIYPVDSFDGQLRDLEKDIGRAIALMRGRAVP